MLLVLHRPRPSLSMLLVKHKLQTNLVYHISHGPCHNPDEQYGPCRPIWRQEWAADRQEEACSTHLNVDPSFPRPQKDL
jgi:hypothetical protein